MISREHAILITSSNFPKGPEKLAEHLRIRVESSPLTGVEGWCVRGKPNTVIRVNSTSSPFRQRFTLSHELAHLVLGIDPDVATEPFRSKRGEELEADGLASEFLIPSEQLRTSIGERLPIDAKSLERLAKTAQVSPVVAACRVVSATHELKLENAAVVFFKDGEEQWRYSQGLRFDKDSAHRLFQNAMERKPDLVRVENRDGKVIVGSIVNAMVYQVLLIQLLPEEKASQATHEEEIRGLAAEVFGSDQNFRQSVAARIGVVMKSCAGKSLEDAFDLFYKKYVGTAYTGQKAAVLTSAVGKKYVRMHFQRRLS